MSQYSGMQMPILKDASDTEQVRRMGLDLLSYINQIAERMAMSVNTPGLVGAGNSFVSGYVAGLGYYIKLSDGTMECWNMAGNIVNGTAIAFPISFVYGSIPQINITLYTNSSNFDFYQIYNPSNSSFYVNIRSSTGAASNGYVSWSARGRWK